MLNTVRKTNRNIVYATLSSTILMGVSNIFGPFLAPYLSQHGFTRTQISNISSLSPLLLIVCIPVIEEISDRIGRKRILNIALLLYALSLILYLLIDQSYLLLIAATLLSTFAYEAFQGTSLARAEDGVSEHRGRFTGYFESIKTIGSISGSILGTFLVTFFPIGSTIKVSLIIVFTLFLLGLLNRDTHNTKKIELREFNFIRDIKKYLSIKELREITILDISMSFHHPAIIVFIPLFITQDLKLKLEFVGFFTIGLIIGHLFQFLFGYSCELYGNRKNIRISVFVYSVALGMLAFTSNSLALLLISLILGLSGAAWSTAVLCDLCEIGEKRGETGLVVGSYASMAYISVFASFLLSGIFVKNFGIRPIFIIYAILSLLALAATGFNRTEK